MLITAYTLVENMSTETTARVSLLAIAWERKVQVAKLVKSELKVYGKWSLDSAAIGLAWLDDQVLNRPLFLSLFISLLLNNKGI